MEKEYQSKYGSLPDSQEELLELIQEKYKVKDSKIKELLDRINSLEWIEKTLSKIKTDLDMLDKKYTTLCQYPNVFTENM